jgi:hypothetical protein
MYAGHLGTRHHADDPNQLGQPERERTGNEQALMVTLKQAEIDMRVLLLSIPNDGDPRATATALTKLDELVMWAKRSIDK